MRYLTNDTNLVADATLAATNVIASQSFELTSRNATGGGIVSLTGSYTGSDDAVFDLEVTSTTINGAPQISAPVFAGVGNGAISGIGATSALAAQEFTVTVTDTGTETRAAWAPFQSVNLEAQTVGTAGNDYTVRISQAGLTATATDYAVTVEMGRDGEEFVGEEYNFGAVTIEPEGTVPTTAPRIRFGDDVAIYRHWRSYRDGRYRYHLSPALRRDVPVGTRVYSITGGREVTVYDGATLTDTHTGITTLYSLLTAIETSSTLLSVDGVIANDRRPGGMACDDLSVFTASYVNGSVRDGSRYIRNAAITLTVASDAPTETLRAECIAAPIPGAEIWSVVGTVAGELEDAVSGVAFSDGDYGFTIPQELQPGSEPEGDRAAYLDLLARDAGSAIPSLCVKNFRLGAEAKSQTYTFEWRPHPGAECDCRSEPISGGPNNDFLGIDDGGVAVATLPAAVKTLYQDIATWRKGALALNCYFTNTDDDTQLTAYYSGLRVVDSAEMLANGESVAPNFPPAGILNGVFQKISVIAKMDEQDIRAITMVADLFQTHLLAIYTEMGGTGALDSAVETAFQTEWDYIVDALTPLMYVSNNGSTSWKTGVYQAFIHSGYGSGSTVGDPDLLQVYLQQAIAGAKNLTQNLEPLLRRCQASITNVYIAGNLLSPFDSAALTGNSVWQDHNESHWFVSQDGLLPIQPGWYYHSAKMAPDPDTGEDVPTSTREFGIGVAIGCIELLQTGDKLIITTSPYANGRATYQQGDYIEWEIVRADPVALGGGQTGNDTITMSVRGSDVGALANYSLVTTSPTSYSNGGLSFTVTPGGIGFATGDRWTFSAEGGEFRWRVDYGSWTTADIAATVALTAGVSASFAVGETPSFEVGDTYQLTALAVNGVGELRDPDDGAMSWATSQALTITPSPSTAVSCLLIAHHTIASTATITLAGSDDNFATTPYSATVPWASGTIGYLLDAARTYAKWRVSINEAGSIGWVYLGAGTQLTLPTGKVENGDWRQRIYPATAARSRAIAGDISHSAVTQASFDTFLARIESALTDDDGRIGLISAAGDGAYVRVDGDVLQLSDARLFQSAAADRLLSLTVPVAVI